MIENTAQALGAIAPLQYGQTRAAAGQATGLFSNTLEAAMANGSAAQAAIAAASGDKSAFSLADFAPLLLSGLSQGEGGEGLLVLLMAMLAGGGNGDLLGGMSGSDSAALLLGGMGGLTGSGGSSLFGDAGGFGSGLGGSASSQAAMVAAQSLFKAYQGSQGGGVASLLGAAGGFTGGGAVRANAVASGPVAAGTGAAVGSNKAPGREVEFAVTSAVGRRSPALYRAVIDQFNVENNPRYAVNQKGTGDTYCNIFMWDVTSAMGAEIPHRIDRDTGAPARAKDGNTISMNANRTSDWLNTKGPQYGWYEVTAEQAQALANRGCPAVTVWKNKEGGHGHVQVVAPSEDGAYDPKRGVAIAQAGRLLRNNTYITKIYSSRMKDVQYFAHR